MNRVPTPFFSLDLLGKGLIVIGLILVAIGVMFLFRDRVSVLRHLGHLPGDFSIERENFRFYFPLTTSLLLSALLSLILWLFKH